MIPKKLFYLHKLLLYFRSYLFLAAVCRNELEFKFKAIREHRLCNIKTGTGLSIKWPHVEPAAVNSEKKKLIVSTFCLFRTAYSMKTYMM